jgi:DNA-directed RNA polymerase specialized sigma subunit
MSLDSLTKLCSDIQLSDVERKILTEYYVNRKSLQYIANKVGYSIDNVKKIKAKIIKRIID